MPANFLRNFCRIRVLERIYKILNIQNYNSCLQLQSLESPSISDCLAIVQCLQTPNRKEGISSTHYQPQCAPLTQISHRVSSYISKLIQIVNREILDLKLLSSPIIPLYCHTLHLMVSICRFTQIQKDWLQQNTQIWRRGNTVFPFPVRFIFHITCTLLCEQNIGLLPTFSTIFKPH